jgi:hypothetical protein
MKNVLKLLFFASLIAFSCDSDLEVEEIEFNSKINLLLNSEKYNQLIDDGYEFDEDEIESKKIKGKILYMLSISSNPSSFSLRTLYAKSDMMIIAEDGSESPNKPQIVDEAMIISYENLPAENYTGFVDFYDTDNQSDVVTFEFLDGDLIDKGNLNPPISTLGCSFRRALACAGYRIENYNWVDKIAYVVGFPGSLLWEIGSCLADGCPYE